VTQSRTRLVVGVGDIHGRFHRVAQWLADLQDRRGQAIDAAFAVGDVEAFLDPEDHRRKAVKRGMPAEFAEYARGERAFPCPLFCIGGNNEDFATLERMPEGGELAPGVSYLGRAGKRSVAGLEVAFLSGIYAPRWFALAPSPVGTTAQSWKQAGYFRQSDLSGLNRVKQCDLLLLHEWPRGISARGYLGNPVSRDLVMQLGPPWVFLGHSHRALGKRLPRPAGGEIHVACLDQATRPEGALIWLEWEDGRVA
jgi:hypothetical protein